MLIYTVSQRETLRDIADKLATTTRELLRLNELDNEHLLVPGLHLLFPGPATLAQSYTVRSGDTLPRIAQRIGVSASDLENWTGLRDATGTRLTPGQKLVLPKRVIKKRTIEVNGYLLPAGTQTDTGILQDVGRALTYLCIFSYWARADGSLQETRDRTARATARRYNVVPLMTVTNFDGQGFNTELAHTILANSSIRRTLIDTIVRTLRERGFGGVNVDFEHMRPTDRELYNRFIADLRQAVKAAGFSISIAMGPKTQDEPTASWMGAFDYKTLGGEVDFLMLMTYEWGWVGGPPMAIAPIDQVRAVLNYATSVIPPSKILMGMALYGYDWPLPHPQAGRASGIDNNSAQNLAMREQVPIQFDGQSASPFYEYTSADGTRHRVWFEDALSAAAKMELVYEYGLRGISYWVLGNEFSQNWYMLEDSFEVRKNSGRRQTSYEPKVPSKGGLFH